ncbi:MAG: 6-phosphogluconolactonase [Chloroflexi bacterium]|nr:6-phosphogluconolactonase [Chloroflexota bacterium]
MTPEIVVVPDPAALARQAAERFVALARQAIAHRERFSVALSGGSTPRDLYALLAAPEFAAQVDWARVYFFWGDERAVPPDDPASNFRMAYETLLSRVPAPPENIFRIPAEKEPQQAAREYDGTLREFFKWDASPSKEGAERGQTRTPSVIARRRFGPTKQSSIRELKIASQKPLAMTSPNPRSSALVRVPYFPRLDLILLGLGANGHTASLFPHTAVLRVTTRWVEAEYVAEVKMNRITLTAPVINAARNILFLVSGADKAQTVHAVLRGEYRPDDLPAQLIQPTDGALVWLLDRAAASAL